MNFDVVIPTTGRPELARALESVRNQTYEPRKVFVVLDRPSEEHRVRAMLAGESLILTKGGERGGAARNLGIAAAEADYVAFLDDDDWWEPRKLELQLAALSRSGSPWATCSTTFHRRDGQKDRLPKITPPSDANKLGDYLISRRRIRFGDGMIQSSSLVVESKLAKAQPWAGRLPRHQDWDWVIKLSKAAGKPPMFVSEAEVNVVQDSVGSVSRSIDWQASAHWIESRASDFSPRARSDFYWSIVVRSAIATGSWRQLRSALRRMPAVPPHYGAAVVAVAEVRRWRP